MDDGTAVPISFRLLKAGDVETLADLWVESWQVTMPALDFAARRPWITAFLTGPEAATRPTIVSIGRNGQPTGFVTVEPGRAYLHQLVVAVAAKGGATARALLDAAKAAAPDGLALDVNQDNTRAIRFYEREGFLCDGAGANAASGLATWRMSWAP